MKAIVNGTVVLPDRVIPDGAVLMDGGRIVDVGARAVLDLSRAEEIDAGGNFIGPGLVDIHCHAAERVWAYQDPVYVANHHLRGGATSMCLTMYHQQTTAQILSAFDKVRDAMENETPGNIIGIHFEGPYLSQKYGASGKTARLPDPEEYQQFLDEGHDLIRHWAFSPELPGVDEFVDAVSRYNIPLNIAHTEASPEQIYKYIPKGLRICTHLMNATGVAVNPPRFGGTREVGVDEAVMVDDRMFCELIPDSRGVHVCGLLIKLIFKTVGVDRVVAITDCCVSDETVDNPDDFPPEDVRSARDLNFVDGGLFGSRLLMWQACQNTRRHAGLDMIDTFKIGALNPARAIRMESDIGSLLPGRRANAVIVDKGFELKNVVLNGELCKF